MTRLDRVIGYFAPGVAAGRAKARLSTAATQRALMHYDAATVGRRSAAFNARGTDADAAAARRERLAFIARDMVRNTPFALRAQQVIASNVVGSGIIPKITTGDPDLDAEGLELIEKLFDTTAIDRDGRQNLYGLQRLIVNGMVDGGEMLVLPCEGDGPFGFQLKVLEADFLDTSLDGRAFGSNHVHEGIEYDANRNRVAYHVYDSHPGTNNLHAGRIRLSSDRIMADRVWHVYRQDRAGQMRGVSWFAPIALNLADLGDYQDAQIMRQKIAACFAAFHKVGDELPEDDEGLGGTLEPGAIQRIGENEEIVFADPPDVGSYDEFTRGVLRSAAAGMGITYEAMTGDLSGVNFSSARMGRMEMDRNVEAWQWLVMVPLFLQPLGDMFKRVWIRQNAGRSREIMNARISWVPPRRPLIDPNKEIPALVKRMQAGLSSRSEVIRELGSDPQRVNEEITADHAFEQDAKIRFTGSVEVLTAAEGAEGSHDE